MEESSNSAPLLKRQREEEVEEGIQELEEVDVKRQKSYKDIITLLEEDEDEPNQDLSSLISTLQEELSSGSGSGSCSDPFESDPDPEKLPPSTAGYSGSEGEGEGEVEGEKVSVMRHLLEASDDELGIPSSTDGGDSAAGGQVDGGDLFPVGESLWEFEDHEADNYYNLLQCQVFTEPSSPSSQFTTKCFVGDLDGKYGTL